MSTNDDVCSTSSEYYSYRSNEIILSHGNGDDDWVSRNFVHDPAIYRSSLGLAELHENYKYFEEPVEYVSNVVCPNRCLEYCWWLTEDNILPQTNLPLRYQRKCAGFWFHGNSTHYHCYFAVGTQEYPPRSVSQLTSTLSGDWNVLTRGSSQQTRDYVTSLSKIIKGSFFKINPLFPPPPHPPGHITPPPFLPPTSSPPPPSVENLILRPEILIPLIIGSVLLSTLFVYIFRLCTKERADAFNRVFRTITRRKKNRIVIDTKRKVESRQAVRK